MVLDRKCQEAFKEYYITNSSEARLAFSLGARCALDLMLDKLPLEDEITADFALRLNEEIMEFGLNNTVENEEVR